MCSEKASRTGTTAHFLVLCLETFAHSNSAKIHNVYAYVCSLLHATHMHGCNVSRHACMYVYMQVEILSPTLYVDMTHATHVQIKQLCATSASKNTLHLFQRERLHAELADPSRASSSEVFCRWRSRMPRISSMTKIMTPSPMPTHFQQHQTINSINPQCLQQ